MTFLTGVPPDPELIRCGLPVQVAFTDLPDGNVLPVFRPAGPDPARGSAG